MVKMNQLNEELLSKVTGGDGEVLNDEEVNPVRDWFLKHIHDLYVKASASQKLMDDYQGFWATHSWKEFPNVEALKIALNAIGINCDDLD